jgi:hypothetical protein
MKCGTKLPKGAEFCSKCGLQVSSGAKDEKKDYSGIGGTLILVGGILGLVLSIIPLMFMWMMRYWMGMRSFGRWTEMPGGWNGPMVFGGWMMGFMVGAAIISIVLGILAIFAYRKVRSGEVKNGGIIAIILGVIMLVTMNWLQGIIILIGGVLCYTSK